MTVSANVTVSEQPSFGNWCWTTNTQLQVENTSGSISTTVLEFGLKWKDSKLDERDVVSKKSLRRFKRVMIK